jgi:hypothetical protein
MVTRFESGEQRVDGGHPGGKGKSGGTGLDRGDVTLEGEPGRVLGAAVFEPFVLSEAFLNVGRRLINRRDDGVASPMSESHAHYGLRDCHEVKQFLSSLLTLLQRRTQ